LFTARILRAAALFCSSRNSLDDLWLRLAGTNSAWFVSWMSLAILADLILVFVGAMRWKQISALCGASLGLTQAFRYNMIGTFFNQTLPSTIGGRR